MPKNQRKRTEEERDIQKKTESTLQAT